MNYKQLVESARHNSGSRKALQILQGIYGNDKIKNPLFEIWKKLHGENAPFNGWNRTYQGMDKSIAEMQLRDLCINYYAFAIPPDDVIKRLATEFPRIIEVGAGLGYWANLIAKAGGTIEAYDLANEHNTYWKGNEFHRWFPIRHFTELFERGWKDNDTLMLCWPPYDEPMCHRWVSYFTHHSNGKNIILIGEGSDGCTGWSELLDEGGLWKPKETIHIPQWEGIHDYLTIFERIT